MRGILAALHGVDGEIYEVGEAFRQLRQPSKPIPPEFTAITGIDDAMVGGQEIDPQAVAKFAAPAALVIAHNAAFDRKFLERFSEMFNTKPWACSMSEVDWAREGYEGAKLAYFASSAGPLLRAPLRDPDCLSALELLARTHPVSGRTDLAQLLDRAGTPTRRIWAEDSPFDLEDQLKARGYRWNAEVGGAPGTSMSPRRCGRRKSLSCGRKSTAARLIP